MCGETPFALLRDDLAAKGVSVDEVKSAIEALEIDTPRPVPGISKPVTRDGKGILIAKARKTEKPK